jgi:hypothetical protein
MNSACLRPASFCMAASRESLEVDHGDKPYRGASLEMDTRSNHTPRNC